MAVGLRWLLAERFIVAQLLDEALQMIIRLATKLVHCSVTLFISTFVNFDILSAFWGDANEHCSISM
ncbi:hypothetical protein H671_6g16763 [Cricetulus griseus]|nr:hypothetical protein H671_6g16763 [Cricetulus griseus]